MPTFNVCVACGLSLSLLLAGCAVGPSYHEPSIATPAKYKESAGQSSTNASNDSAWWRWFDDPDLDELERQVVVSNQNIASAEAAYREAVAAVSVQRAAFWPNVGINASAQRSRQAPAAFGATGTSVVTQSFAAGASASWQLDLWGRLRRELENVRATAQATEADLVGATLSNQTLLAISYLQLREADAELRLLTDTVSAYERAAQITDNRYQAGVAAKSDSLQAHAQLANTLAERDALLLQRAQFEHAIAALIGRPAAELSIAAKDEWNAVVPVIPAGLPSELLRRRADVVASERRVAAASANIGIQKAAYFPSLTLTGAYNFISHSIDTIFSPANVAWSAGAAASGTLFDAGATSGRVRAARAAYDASVAEYRQTVFNAFKNVEDELAGVALLAQETSARQEASQAASEAELIVINQYNAGRVSYTDVIVAQAAALTARRNLAEVELARQTTAVDLVAAFGGGWDGALTSQ